MITRVRREKKCESDREVDYDITISKKKEKYGSNVMMRATRNQKKTHRDTKKKGEEEKWKEGRKTMSIRNSRKKGQDQSQ